MKYIVLLCLFFSLSSYGQYEWTSGEIYMKNGDIHQGLVKIPEGHKGLHLSTPKVKFKKTKEAKKKKFKETKIEKILVNTPKEGQQEFRMMPANKRHKRLFHIIVDGKTKLYSRNLKGQAMRPMSGGGVVFTGNMGSEVLVLKEGAKSPEDLFELNWFKSFKGYATDYFSDCPSLVEKLENETYTEKDIKQIVVDYNHCQ